MVESSYSVEPTVFEAFIYRSLCKSYVSKQVSMSSRVIMKLYGGHNPLLFPENAKIIVSCIKQICLDGFKEEGPRWFKDVTGFRGFTAP